MPLEFVNYLGEKVSTVATKQQKKKDSSTQEEFHKGHRVMGHPPNAIEQAKIEHEKRQSHKMIGDRKPFDPAFWIMNAKKKPVRSTPYALREAAEQCADMAAKAGWTHVEVVAIEKKAQKP